MYLQIFFILKRYEKSILLHLRKFNFFLNDKKTLLIITNFKLLYL